MPPYEPDFLRAGNPAAPPPTPFSEHLLPQGLTTRSRRSVEQPCLYTGVTRGRRLVVLVGQPKAVAIAVRDVSGRRRWSKLWEWLGTASNVTRRFPF